PNDKRVFLLMALLDYAEGNVKTGISQIKQLLPRVADPALAAIARKVMSEGETLGGDQTQLQAHFAKLLALPGSAIAADSGMRKLGDEYLKRGSFLLAMKCFYESRDLVEIGRTYLALASHLFSIGDEKGAAISAGFGKNALVAALRNDPTSSKAHLYLALYYFERNEIPNSKQHIEAGLGCPATYETKRRLLALRNQS
ncbi:hypothetical protein HYY75_09250, partial [bacterium]|nr:hypothetical protein [bacterium]